MVSCELGLDRSSEEIGRNVGWASLLLHSWCEMF